MKRPPISDAQMDLLATRLAAAGVGRRDFLRVAAGLAAMGAAGFNARPAAAAAPKLAPGEKLAREDRKSTRLNSSHITISYAVFCLKKKKQKNIHKHIPNHKNSE